jgi:hypothetical protein
MTRVGKRLSATGIVLALAGSVSQVLGAELRPDPLLSIDQNRRVAIERIVEVFRPAFGPSGVTWKDLATLDPQLTK